MTLEQPLFLEPALGDPDITYTAQQVRVLFDVMSFLTGVTLRDDLKVTQRGAGANMSVDVAAGSAIVRGGTVTYQGKYLVRSTATVNVPVGAAPGSGTRTDLIVAQVYDNEADSSGLYSWTPLCVPGTTTPPASSIPLARITVAAGTGSITTAMIDGSVRLLNTLGDVPLWEVSGGNGQAIANNTIVPYSGFTVSDAVGMAAVDPSLGATISLPGRYVVTAGGRIDTGGASAARDLTIAQTRGGTRIRTATDEKISAVEVPHAVATTFRCNTGDVINMTFAQGSGVTLHLKDTFHECYFTGVWTGP